MSKKYNKLQLILRYTWAVYFFILFLLVFLLLYPFFLLFLSRRSTYPYAHLFRRIWGRTIMFLSGLRPFTWYDAPLDKKKAYVFVANHFSYLDILSLNVQLGHYFRFMAKSELANIPLFKIFFRTIDIAVDRKSVRNSIKAYQYAERVLTEGDSLGIFPEGGIGPQVPVLAQFKSGAFKMAIETKTPIVPITIVDNWKRLPGGGFVSGGTPGPMRMVVHKPIDTTTMQASDVPYLMDKVHNIIQNNFDKRNFADSYENH